MTFEKFVLDTLNSPRVDDLNFQFGPTNVYPQGYRRDIEQCIKDGHINFVSKPTYDAVAYFIMNTPRGQPHSFVISPHLVVEERSGVLQLRALSNYESIQLRGTVIHECTHALQVYQRISLSPAMSEASAYFAEAITMWRWHYTPITPVPNPRVSGHAFALFLAKRFLSTPHHARYIIPANDVQTLCGLVDTGSASQYVFNGI